MFVKITSSGSRRYLQLVEAFRDEHGKPKQRTVASLGRLDQIGDQLEQVIAGLARATGKPLSQDPATPTVTFESTRSFGDVWALTELWHELGFDQLRYVFRRTRHEIDVEALLRIMVFNRLCDPESKLGVLRWLETVTLPGLTLEAVTHQHLLRAMDALLDQHDAVESTVAKLLRPLIDQELAVVFYDMTTIRAAGLSQQDEDLRHYGMSKEGIVARQFMLGVVQTAEGLPLYHEVFDGNTAEVTTLQAIIEKLVARFPVKRMVIVADRGLLSQDNLAQIQAITLPCGASLEFILAVPGRRYAEVAAVLTPLQAAQFKEAKQEIQAETEWDQMRLIVAHNPETAQAQTAKRAAKIAELEQQAAEWVTKLEGQDEGKRQRGRKLSDGGVRAKFYRAVCEAHLTRIIQVDLKSEQFTYSLNEAALQQAQLMDGKLLLLTNTKDLTTAEVVQRYKSLADIERGFRVLKSEIEIGPVHHRLPDRIRAHATICFIALILYRVMRQRLHAAQANTSPERALAQLRRIQHHRIQINQTQPVTGLSTTSKEQHAILSALNLAKPHLQEQLSLL
jgi:transposase